MNMLIAIFLAHIIARLSRSTRLIAHACLSSSCDRTCERTSDQAHGSSGRAPDRPLLHALARLSAPSSRCARFIPYVTFWAVLTLTAWWIIEAVSSTLKTYITANHAR